MKKQNETNKQQMSLNTAKNSSKNRKKLTLHKVAKGMQGITLIALVVTIIVLLILAGIALNLTIGQNGIFSRAEKAANTWRNAESNEQLALGELADWMDKYANGKGETGETKEPEEGTLAWMFEQAEKDGCTNDDGRCDNPNHLHIGDYVNFEEQTKSINKTEKIYDTETGYENNNIDSTGNSYQSYTVNSSTNQLYWRVLGYDSNKNQVKLITSTPLVANNDGKNNDGYLWLYGALAYTKASNAIDNLCYKLYGGVNGVVEARSVKQSDIDAAVGITTADQIRQYNLDAYYGNKNYRDSYNFPNAYTLEEFLADPDNYSSKPASGISGTVTGYYYTINGEDDEGAPYVTVENQRIVDMPFTDIEDGSGGTYWLSSPGVLVASDCATFGPGSVYSIDGLACAGSYYTCDSYSYGNVSEGDFASGVRPVVSLDSSVQGSVVSRVADKTDPEWKSSGIN